MHWFRLRDKAKILLIGSGTVNKLNFLLPIMEAGTDRQRDLGGVIEDSTFRYGRLTLN